MIDHVIGRVLTETFTLAFLAFPATPYTVSCRTSITDISDLPFGVISRFCSVSYQTLRHYFPPELV